MTTTPATAGPHRIDKPYYPIVYVRGYAMTENEREDVFHDAYYGFSATSVEKRNAPPPRYFEVDIFEGQFIRLMKLKDYAYADAVNKGLTHFHSNPTRSIWISRFYDRDYLHGSVRSIVEHAEELYDQIVGPAAGEDDLRSKLKKTGCDFGPNDEEFKVILVAHSMGGLVCRTLIQNIMPKKGIDPKAWIHRLVTIGSPHGGIELGRVPDALENFVAKTFNPFDSGLFNPRRMREYLNLTPEHDPHSLGDSGFPVKRCFCIIGSDHASYNATRMITGGFSDGLVKQDRAYVVAGRKPAGDYREQDVAYGANVHRAHSGNRGIVNSYESYENLHRFLFGDVKAAISLANLHVNVPTEDQGKEASYFYDFEFLASIKGTGVYLQRREQDPCENALRFKRENLPSSLQLYTGFLNTALKTDEANDFSEFALTIRVVEHRVEKGLFWDHEYPGRHIYNETLLIRVGDFNPDRDGQEVRILWLSDRASDWTEIEPQNSTYDIPLRTAQSVSGSVRIAVSPWPDPGLTLDDTPATKDR
ncbi:MAG TPA: hypothetical protein VE974_03415 [Thermoanaerobaculia bacterium]|nr:hypothetical protein [Thermoanaerobaculia bacterium]